MNLRDIYLLQINSRKLNWKLMKLVKEIMAKTMKVLLNKTGIILENGLKMKIQDKKKIKQVLLPYLQIIVFGLHLN